MRYKLNSADQSSSATCVMHIIGGQTMTMSEYESYLRALSIKPFLTAQEASTYFDIGVNKVYRLMKDPDADFVVKNKTNGRRKKQYTRIHREMFEKWLILHGDDVPEEV